MGQGFVGRAFMEGFRSGKVDRTFFLKIYIRYVDDKSISADGGVATLPYTSFSSFPLHSNIHFIVKTKENGSIGFSLPPTSRLSHSDRSGSCAGRIICSSEKSERLSGFAVGREKIEWVWCDDVCELDECFAYA